MQNYEKKWQILFDDAVVSSQKEHQKNLYGSAADELSQRKLVCDLLFKNLKGGKKIIADIGCGTGGYFAELHKRGYETIGCDYSWNMLCQAKAKTSTGLVQATTDNIPYKEKYFDAVLSIGVLQTVYDYKKAMAELYCILKPGGILVLSTLRVPIIWELPLFPLVEILMYDHSIQTGQWYQRLIKDRKGLSWHNRPSVNRARRYKMEEITGCLRSLGFNNVRHYYLGRIQKIPLLINSQLVTFSAVKSK